MKVLGSLLAATTALTVPSLAMAKDITVDTKLMNYGGEDAYLAYYLTDASGKYVRTLHIASGKSRWWDHLTGWYSATAGNANEIAGLTGASVGSGSSLKFTVDVEDALIDAGYQIRVDAAVEHMPNSPAEIVVPLTSDNAGKTVAGRGYIASFTFDM
ncbi:DUF2271 domain-containing protein [Donghicola sp. C2-DW-16]|uniref:DUF2271 domain-containing protein n=1 Tax=Donghicola mangrovi TaxID=2729614 RepID=A0A850Q4T8_9RHOB|nr:DUF2271 domain-containing protein [Donghicola mangrovi]NVO23964.1 DUF2271 domain-containing protein [Donghicola mangrovi]NVO27499.1 DUF2271 domain-containing protein [Donghicola mangrovi]